MKQLETLILLKLKEVTKVTPEEITLLVSELTKDIAIGFAEWSQYNCFRHEGDWVYDKTLYTSEELFNEYLNTLK